MRTKQTAHGGKSQCPKGMATVTFSSSTDADPEQQQEVTGGDTEDSQEWPDILEEATQGVAGSSKSKGEAGDQPQQAEGGAQAPPKEIPPAPEPSNPKPGTSKDPTDAPTKVIPQDPTQPPQDPKQPTTQNPDEDTPPELTKYVKAYKEAGKLWLDTVVENKEQAYIMLFDTLQQLGSPHIDNFDQANRSFQLH